MVSTLARAQGGGQDGDQSQTHRRAEGKAVLIDIVGDGVSGSQKAGESQRRRAQVEVIGDPVQPGEDDHVLIRAAYGRPDEEP